MDVTKYSLILSGILIRSIYRSFFRLPKRLLPRSVLLLLALSTQASSIVVDSAGAGFPGLFENDRSTAYVNLSSDHELDQLLGYVVTQFPDHIIRYITKATDLQEGGLETRLFLDDQGNVSAPAPGMMFNDRAVILVVDYRQMTATQVAELNGILDSVRTYNGKRLSNTTRILAVADESVLSAAWSADAPGSDFWRRVNNIGQAPDISLLRKQASHCVPTLEQYVRRHVWDSIPFDVSHLPAKTLDFASGLSAGDVLSGGIELDSGGGLIFRDAALGDFGDALFILKDAPWEDIAFKVQLANTLASRGMDSGDQCLALPARFFLQRKDTSPGVMAQTLEAFGKRHQDAETRWFPLNSVNFDLVFSEMALRKGQLVKSGVGGNLKQNFQGIEVTSTLTNHQWKRLTGLLSAGGQLENLTLRVREKDQPVVVPDNLFQRQEEAVNGSLVQRLSGTLSLEKIREEHPGAHIEVVSPSLDASQLLETIRMESRQNRRFQKHSTDFYKALQTSARQIIITGLESNPDIQKLLEPLLSGTPSVPRFGQLSLINSQPDIRVQWLEPGLAVTSSWSEWLSHNPEHDEAAPSVSSPSEPVHVNWNRPEQLVKTVSEAIQNHALVYLEGPPGSGKSYTASRVAKKLAGQQTVYQLTTGPTSRRQDLFGEQALRPLPDYPDDSETLFVEGPILQWAQQRSKNGEPVILILDEGNLLDKNVQVLLSGVTLQQPFISSNGDAYYLTPEHRLVITGNPLSFEGRYLIPELHNHAKTIRFAAMDSSGLSGQVIAPFLEVMDSQRCQRDGCDWIADLLLDNLAGYQGQLPGYSFSARDTLDVLSRFQFYLGDLAQKSTHEIENTLKQALHDSFSGLLAGQKRSVGLSSRAYYVKHHAFDAFYERLKHQSTSLNLENDSTRTLARRIWLELERVAGENNHHRSHPGRHGMMIEGPAGRGKDVVLDIVMKQWREDWALKGLILPPPLRITAGYNNWDRLKALIIRAKTEGRILIVSELNLLPTHFLEGVLNDVLSGEAAPGFFLIATVNPVQYSGRHAFSSALASRFTQLILDEYTLNDFKVIAASYTDSSFSDDIALWHHKRVETLKQNKALAVPAVMMMIEYLKALDKSEAVNPNALRNRFMTFYRLYLKDGWRPEPIVVPVEADVVKILEKELAPVPETSLMTKLFSLVVGEPETKETKEEATEGQTPEAVYHSGQPATQNEPAKVVPEVEKPDQRTTGKQPQPFMERTAAVMEQGVAATVDTIANVLQAARGYIPANPLANVLQAARQHAPFNVGQHLPDFLKKYLPKVSAGNHALDGDFHQRQTNRLNKRFTSDFPSAFYRMDIKWLKIYDNGEVKLEPFPAGELTHYQPDSVQTDLSESLLPGQHHGTQDITRRGTLTSLFPHEKLVAIWTEDNRGQPVEVQYDARRGIYTANLPDAGYFSKTQLHYVVEEDKAVDEAESLAPSAAYQAPLVWINRLNRLMSQRPLLAIELDHYKSLSQKQRVESIIAYVKRFTAPDKAIESLKNQKSDIEMLAELIERRIGTCRHIAYAAAGLMQFYGIPVRVMFNESHTWVEYSLNNGKTWQTSETWGTYGGAENPEDFGDQSLISGHDDSDDSSVATAVPEQTLKDESTVNREPSDLDDSRERPQMALPTESPKESPVSSWLQPLKQTANYLFQSILKSREGDEQDLAEAYVPKRSLQSKEKLVIQRIFYHSHNTDHYRQSIQHVVMEDNGRARFVDLPYHGIRIPVALPSDIEEQQLSNPHALRGQQVVKAGEKTQLGSLYPHEKLLALSSEGVTPEQFLVEYDAFQGLYFVTVNKGTSIADDITLHFLIQEDEPSLSRKTWLTDKQLLDKQQPKLINAELRKKVDDFFAEHSELYKKIGIEPGMDSKVKMEKILAFTEQFRLALSAIEDSSLISLFSQMKHILESRCNYRFFIATMLAEYFEVGTVRKVSNDKRIFVEFSADGTRWHSYNLNENFICNDYSKDYDIEPAGLELLQPGLDSFREETRDPRLSGIGPQVLRFVESDFESTIPDGRDKFLEIYHARDASIDKALSLFKHLLLYFNVKPHVMKDLSLLVMKDPKVRQKISPWLSEQIENLPETYDPILYLISKHSKKEVNGRLNGSPFAELERLMIKKTSSLTQSWKYQPPGQLQLSRLLANKAAFAYTSEHHEQQQNRRVIFNVGESPLLDPHKVARYQTILFNKLDEGKENSMSSEEKRKILDQALLDAARHLTRITGFAKQYSSILKRRRDDSYGSDIFALLVYKPEFPESELFWSLIFYDQKDGTSTSFENLLQVSVPLSPNWLPEKWQDSVIVDDDMLDRLVTRYLESLSREQVDNLRKALQSPVQ
ncbi:AAA family ATPase [Endozoicomonas euniceicola]|uniref:AAA family ATPase n=1 Tax=Endozoicomonas euniceicola TaxID=1234143 RepID=A0ABY6GXI8_9GAMM|nr:AAA family ATPase [Endozoicomonas euniceicola]UYM17385.1 AAA family ATPase [Endozoicomonas euniceicola]